MSPEVERVPPPYVQVAIRDQILRGELLPGDPVPSVRELAATWNIARATAEKALHTLRLEGLVEPQPGVGTVVHRKEIYCGIQDRYATVRRSGRIYIPGEQAKTLSAAEVRAPEDVAAAFHVEPGTSVIRRHWLTYHLPSLRFTLTEDGVQVRTRKALGAGDGSAQWHPS